MNITVLGGGAWGTALALHFERLKHKVKIWEFVVEQAEQMQKERTCPMLPDISLPDGIEITSDMEFALKDSEVVLIVVPSDKVDITMKNASKFIDKQPVVICSKGFTSDQRLLSDVVKDHVKSDVYCLYGPTIAIEVAKNHLSGMVLAGEKENEELRKAFEGDKIVIESSTDIIGVQIGAALKNVVTIFVGIMEGSGEGENAKAYIFVKGVREIMLIGTALGAKESTFYGLTCAGDLQLNSRNRKLGIEIGKGRTLEEVTKETNHVLEGVIAVKNAVILNNKLNLHLPLIEGLHRILFEHVNVHSVIEEIK